MMHYKNIENIEDFIKNIILSEVDTNEYKVFLFGSRAKNTHSKHSDWDIGVLGKKKLDIQKIFRLKNIFAETPYRVEIIDFNMVDDAFKKMSLQNIISWN